MPELLPDQAAAAAPVAEPPRTAATIAKNIGRNPVSVWKALRRLGIEPCLVAGHFKFYTAEHEERVKSSMRAANARKGAQ